jgi:hypothetical protein
VRLRLSAQKYFSIVKSRHCCTILISRSIGQSPPPPARPGQGVWPVVTRWRWSPGVGCDQCTYIKRKRQFKSTKSETGHSRHQLKVLLDLWLCVTMASSAGVVGGDAGEADDPPELTDKEREGGGDNVLCSGCGLRDPKQTRNRRKKVIRKKFTDWLACSLCSSWWHESCGKTGTSQQWDPEPDLGSATCLITAVPWVVGTAAPSHSYAQSLVGGCGYRDHRVEGVSDKTTGVLLFFVMIYFIQ